MTFLIKAYKLNNIQNVLYIGNIKIVRSGTCKSGLPFKTPLRVNLKHLPL